MPISLRGGVVPGDTVGAVLERNKGVGPGFEFLRYALAIAVLLSHLSWLVGTSAHDAIVQVQTATQVTPPPAAPHHWFAGLSDWKGVVRAFLVPSFFALSGFLVMGSALRVRRVPTFLAFRVLRIVPALGVEVTLSALVLGPLLTTYTLSRYFSDHLLPTYFFNIVGHPQYLLPGLFVNNPAPLVNGNLWTLPGEFLCYFAMSILMASNVVYKRIMLTSTFIIVTLMLGIGNILLGFDVDFATVSQFSLPMYFFAGSILFFWRDRLPLNNRIFCIAAIVGTLLMSDHRLVYVAPLPVAYCTVAIGMYRVPSTWLLNSGDYSYGIYLYGAPLTQALIQIFPGFRGHVGYVAVPAVAVSYVFAFGSWHLVERHFLKLKKMLPARLFPRHEVLVSPSVGNIVPAPDMRTV